MTPRRLAAWLALLLACAAAAACGEAGPSPERQVRDTLTAYGRATAEKDYAALCDRLYAPSLLEKLKTVGLPCEVAMQEGLADVQDPKLSIGRIRVDGRRATAEVRSTARGQEPSRDVIELEQVGDSWRISSLAGASPPSPAP